MNMDVTSLARTRSTHIYHRWSFLLVLFLTLISTRLSDSLVIIRGMQDQFVRPNLLQDSGDYIACENSSSSLCSCVPDRNTFIWNNETSDGECLVDQEVIKQSSAPGSKFLFSLTTGHYLKAFGNSSFEVLDDGDDFSTRWIWMKTGQLLNVQTLTCLEATVFRSPKFLMAQCNKLNMEQRWKCNNIIERVIVNNGTTPIQYRENWINPSQESNYLNSCNDFSSYKGCYRFSNGDFLRLLNASGNNCNNSSPQCIKSSTIRAPIDIHHPECSLDWSNSTYSVDGKVWLPLRDHPDEFFLLAEETNQERLLQLIDEDRFFQKWNGTLLRLEVRCRSNDHEESEKHCVLFKIQGTFKPENIRLTDVRPTLSVTSSANVSPKQSPSTKISAHSTMETISTTTVCSGSCNTALQEANSLSSKTVPIVVSTVLSFLVVVAVVTTIIFYRHRKGSKSGRNLARANEDNAGQSRSESVYAEPEVNIGTSHTQDDSEYENLDPTSTVSPGQARALPNALPVQGHSEYENIDETRTLPQGQAGGSNRIPDDFREEFDWDFEDETTSLSSDRHVYDRIENRPVENLNETEDHIYQAVEIKDQPETQNKILEGSPEDPPRPESFYDTVEEVIGSEGQLNKSELSKKESDGPVYRVLEEQDQ